MATAQRTADGGYAMIGYARSSGGRGLDFWLVKMDADGNKLWDMIFAGTGDDKGFLVQQPSDGGYIITGGSCGAADGIVCDDFGR